jgi:hypothetical protein
VRFVPFWVEGNVCLTIVKLGNGGNMFDEHRRPVGRLFYLLAFVLV